MTDRQSLGKRLLNPPRRKPRAYARWNDVRFGEPWSYPFQGSERERERSGLAQITFKILSTLLTSPPCIFLPPPAVKSLRGFSPFFRLPPWRRLAKCSVVLVFVADVDPPITCVSVPYVYLHLSLVHLSRAFISVHLSAYHCWSPYTYVTRTRIHTRGRAASLSFRYQTRCVR